ncbi:MAG: hypothetical protein WC553_01930 [Patescibacteria group bacterium]
MLNDRETDESPPTELKELGCTPKQYEQEIEWLKRLYSDTVEMGKVHSEVYGIGVRYTEKRKLTKVEFQRVLADINKMHLIVVQTTIGLLEGVAYWFYTNPQADRLAQDLPARGLLQGAEAKMLFMLHWDCVEPSLLSESSASSEKLIVRLFRCMKPYSHSEMNVAWQNYWNLPSNDGLQSCLY